MSNSQLNELKSRIKSCNRVTLNLSSNVVSDSNERTIFPCKILLTNTQVLRIGKAFVNVSSATRKHSKTQLHKSGRSAGILGRRFGPLLKTGWPLMKNVLKPLVKSVLIPLGLTAGASATDETIQKKFLDQVWLSDNVEWRNEWYHKNR